MAAAPSPAPRTALPPPNRGGLAFAQGRYGLRGNLELLLCDEEDGLWVLWFNNDPEHNAPEPGGPPPGEWSGALRFGTGRRYDGVQVVQSAHGPHHLEVLATSGARTHRLRWNPETAFTTEEPPPAGRVRSASLTENPDGTLWTAVLAEDGSPRLFRADAGAYPRLAWEPAPLAPARPSGPGAVLLVPLPDAPRPGLALLGASGGSYLAPDGDETALPAGLVGAAVVRGAVPCLYVWNEAAERIDVVDLGTPDPYRGLRLPGEGPVTALAATTLDHDPHRTDLVLRRGGRLWHVSDTGGDAPGRSVPLLSRLTRTPGDEDRAVHRTP
ncbi:hypothetical protein STTU_0261 [Streptomyces sp. Tu6071]|uniref:hypothetical protein n=1 Tax=Streptomyces sp. Tu6071 TaxID=355249 RepID=UPI00020E51C9|nr:hypothetical protein [Streptomyces sp. Tu6071]EGJ73050.1 hypothetical protein STTU_0261 [Streptomyces sp. Tu6071]